LIYQRAAGENNKNRTGFKDIKLVKQSNKYFLQVFHH